MSLARCFLLIPALCFCITCAGCGYALYQLAKQIEDAADDDGTTDDTQTASTAPAVEPAKTYAIALGGVAPGRDELILTDASGALRSFGGQVLTFSADSTVIGLLPRPNFASFGDGSGAQIVPQRAGEAAIRYQIDAVEQGELFGATVPPQELIQVLIGEARGQLKNEATIADGVVQLTSRSVTGDAVAAAIRNRVALIDTEKDPGLFAADPLTYYLEPPASSYTAVIEAAADGIYQFSPVDPNDGSHETYAHAEARSFLDAKLQLAYDQAVLTAAAIFDGRTDDPTGGAFAFRSPTAEEWTCLKSAFDRRVSAIPAGCVPGDENFPALAPVQILLHPDVAKYADDRPTFIFYRKRPTGAVAITNTP